MKGRGKHAALVDKIHKETGARVILLLVSDESKPGHVRWLTEFATDLLPKDRPDMQKRVAAELRSLAALIAKDN